MVILSFGFVVLMMVCGCGCCFEFEWVLEVVGEFFYDRCVIVRLISGEFVWLNVVMVFDYLLCG